MNYEKIEKMFENIAISQAKTDEQIKELKISQAKTDEQMKELKISQAKTDEQIKKTDEQMKKTDEKLMRIGIRLGNIGNNQGDVTEEFFINSLKDNLELNGIKYDYLDENCHRIKGNIEDEFDIVLINGNDIAIIETKYKVHINDISNFIDKKYTNFKKLYPEYKNYNHHLAIASFHINEDTKQKALKSNLLVLQRKGKLIQTIAP